MKPEVIQPVRGNLAQVKVKGKGNRFPFLPEFQKPAGDQNRSGCLTRAHVPEEGAEAWLVATWCARPTDQFLDDICHRCRGIIAAAVICAPGCAETARCPRGDCLDGELTQGGSNQLLGDLPGRKCG